MPLPVREWDGVGTHFTGDQHAFFQSLVQEKDAARSSLLHSANEVKTTTVSALQPSCALAHLAGSSEAVEKPLFWATVCMGCLGKGYNEEQKEEEQVLPT